MLALRRQSELAAQRWTSSSLALLTMKMPLYFKGSFHGASSMNAGLMASTVLEQNLDGIKYLVIDGYSAEGRQELRDGGATTAGDLYVKMLKRWTPVPNVHCEVVHPADPGFTYPELDQYHAVAWTGCSLTIHAENDPRVIPQIAFAKHCFNFGIPQFGSCWAIQIAAVAAGGTCVKNPRGREMGFARKITLTPEGRAHPMFEGKPSTFDAFTSHEDEISHLPRSGLNLGGNFTSSIQAAAIRYLEGDFWGVQYHPEYDLKELARLTYCRRKKLIGMGFFRDIRGADEYVKELEELHEDPRNRMDLAWKLGIDADTMDENIRQIEVKNFIQHLVIPYKMRTT